MIIVIFTMNSQSASFCSRVLRFSGRFFVQDLDDNTIPEDVSEKILRFARAAQAVATMRGKSYLSMGSVSMGIAGSIVNPDFFQEYLGMP